MTIISIDPGPVESAFVVLGDSGNPIQFAKVPNDELAASLCEPLGMGTYADRMVIEMIASYGMPVGAEVFETCVWIGRFMERFDRKAATSRLTRNEIKNHLCHSSKANDSNIRQALIDRFGGKEKAIGKKKTPGPLFGVSGDVWAALAVAVTWLDKHGPVEKTA